MISCDFSSLAEKFNVLCKPEAQISTTRDNSGIFLTGMKKPAGFSQAGFRNLFLRFSSMFKAPRKLKYQIGAAVNIPQLRVMLVIILVEMLLTNPPQTACLIQEKDYQTLENISMCSSVGICMHKTPKYVVISVLGGI